MNSLAALSEPGNKVLLINAHAVDIRLPWSRWHQPTGLLQIGSALQRLGCEVEFIDCIGWNVGKTVTKRKVETLEIDGYKIALWRFGVQWTHLDEQIRSLKRRGWKPNQVYVSCAQTTWWQATRDLIARIKNNWFPDAEVILGGVYPSLEPEHARLHTKADRFVIGSIPEVANEIPDLRLYEVGHRPNFAGIYLYHSQSVLDIEQKNKIVPRDPLEIAAEVADKASLGVSEFAFFDEEIRLNQKHHYIEVLQAISALGLKKTRFVGIANILPTLIDSEVAYWMRGAGYQQVYLKCEVAPHGPGVIYPTPYDAYSTCTEALIKDAGFKPRSGAVTAMLSVGYPYEDIEAATERLIFLASIVGSVNLVQYQYSQGTLIGELYTDLIMRGNGHLDLDLLNCKFYPLARLSGIPFEHYLELTRLAALLNSKYRSRTFDFLGDGIIPRAIQQSFHSQAWELFKEAEELDVIPLTPVRSDEVDTK